MLTSPPAPPRAGTYKRLAKSESHCGHLNNEPLTSRPHSVRDFPPSQIQVTLSAGALPSVGHTSAPPCRQSSTSLGGGRAGGSTSPGIMPG
ncbi:hypothetical protein RRG08_039905 [Elysia crispata]|uniref:Uncharacterized protein n=1 Tax=Elysia crispata TaxID=231223 RepID=A0AAE0ZVB6_9GAST|nr:hypothetical protein RRG08_039905 [Elysia crispata]